MGGIPGNVLPAERKGEGGKGNAGLAAVSLASNAAQCVEVLAKHTKVDWNVRDHLGDTPIMHAFKQQKMEIVRVLMKTPGVDLSEIRRQDFTMFQSFLFDAITEYSNKLSDLRRKVPECPVSVEIDNIIIPQYIALCCCRCATISSGLAELCTSARTATWCAMSAGPS